MKEQILNEVKAAMRAKDQPRLTAIRFISAAIKQLEVDSRTSATDEQVLKILTKLAKQRRDAIAQYEIAKRSDLIKQEQFELGIIEEFLPEALPQAEIEAAIKQALLDTGASSMKDMGKVMGILTPKFQGKADMSQVSQWVSQLIKAQ